jgi:hypothetical protein
LEITGKVSVLGDAEFFGQTTFKNILNLESAITRTYREKVGELLKIGDAVYVSGDGEVAKAFADVIDAGGVFKPAIGVVVSVIPTGFSQGSDAATSPEGGENIVHVAIGGTVGGFTNLLPGTTYYLADVETAISATDTTTDTAFGEFTTIASLTNSPARKAGVFIQPLAVAESTTTLLVMPSLFYQEYSEGMNLAPADYQPIYVEDINLENDQQSADDNQQTTDDTLTTTSEEPIASEEPSTPAGEESTVNDEETTTTSEEPVVSSEETTATSEEQTTIPVIEATPTEPIVEVISPTID